MNTVDKEGFSLTIPRDPYETNESYNRRKWYVANLKPTSEELFEEYLTYSRVFNNMVSLNCRYPPTLEKKVKDLASNKKGGGKRVVKKSKIVRKVGKKKTSSKSY